MNEADTSSWLTPTNFQARHETRGTHWRAAPPHPLSLSFSPCEPDAGGALTNQTKGTWSNLTLRVGGFSVNWTLRENSSHERQTTSLTECLIMHILAHINSTVMACFF